ncbi:MAG: phage portal protein [Chloroflexi bacterium]|nr:phage portal protein [Chloroflexota bacterium]
MNRESFPQQLSRTDAERLRAYQEHLDFYGGLQWPGTPRRRERRLTFNYVRAFLDKLTSYLVSGMAVVAEPWDTSPEAAERAQRAGEALRQMVEENALEQLDFETELDTAVLGDGCYKMTWDTGEGRVRITAPDVQGVFAWWVGDDFSRVWRVASRYRLSAEETEAIYGVRPAAQEASLVEVWTAGELQLWVDDTLLEQRPNPYGFIPFVLFPNVREPKRFWGTSDIPPLVEPQRELNRALSQLSLILELSGNPIAVLEGVEEARDIAVQPGAVWELPERARAHLLDLLQGGGVGVHVEFINVLYRALHDLAETPRTAFGDNARNLSGVALEMEMHPLLQKVRRKRLIRAAVYRQRADMALRVLEQRSGVTCRPVRLQVTWGPLLPQDRGRLAREEQLLVETGIHSRHRAMVNLGVEDTEAETARIQEEQKRLGIPLDERLFKGLQRDSVLLEGATE